MAQKVMLIDDLDGSEGAETIKYSVDGQDYEIDLSEKNDRAAGRVQVVAAAGVTSPRSAPGLSLRGWT